MNIPITDLMRWTRCVPIELTAVIARLFVAVILCGAAAPAHTAYTAHEELATLSSSLIRWSGQEEMLLFGVPVHLRAFTSPAPMHEAAQTMALRIDLFQHATAFKDKIMLSGTKSEWHWVAEIESAPHGARGVVSALYIRPEQLDHALKSSPRATYQWLPSGSRLRFSQHSGPKNRRVVQEIYSVSLPSDQLSVYLKKSLHDSGWDRDVHLGWLPAASVWRRKESRLVLISRASPDGSSLFVHHLE